MELFQTVEQQPTPLQHSGSSVLWLGAALVLVWLLGAGRISMTAVDSILSNLTTMIQSIF